MPHRLSSLCVVSTIFVSIFVALLIPADPAAGAEVAPPGHWECWGPGLPDPCRNLIYDIAIVPGSAEAWAAGAAGTLLHWDGAAWTKVASPTTENLRGIAFARADYGFAAGENGAMLRWNGSAWSNVNATTDSWFRTVGFVPGSNGALAWGAADKAGVGLFVQWNGSGWNARVGGQVNFFGGAVYDLAMLAAGDGWAVGARVKGMSLAGQALHWDGVRWTEVAAPDPALYTLDMLGPADGWAAGDDGALAHWDGRDWSLWPASPTTEPLRGIDMLSDREGWAVGEAGTIVRWNGSEWRPADSPVTHDLYAVAMESPAAGWAAGEGGTILRWDGGAWSVVVQPATERLEDLAFSDGGRVGWAVGTSREPLLWNGHTWRAVAGAGFSYYAVDALSPTDAWTAGIGMRMYHWDGRTWTQAPALASALGIAMLASDDVWAVGWGKLQHWDGRAWSLAASPTTRTLYGMDVLATDDIWAAGDAGTILHYDGAGWSVVPSPNTLWLADISMATPADGWIVGQAGAMLRWDGKAWAEAPDNPSYRMLRGVSVARAGAATVGWAVGDRGDTLWLQNGVWTAGGRVTGNDLWAVEMASRYEAWAVGDQGVILHWVDPARPQPDDESAYLPAIQQ